MSRSYVKAIQAFRKRSDKRSNGLFGVSIIMNRKNIAITVFVIITSIISVSAHALILQFFQPPQLNIPPYLNLIIGFSIRFGMIIAAMFIYACSRNYWTTIHPVLRVVLFAALLMALTEQLFRDPIMQIIVGNPWKYQIVKSIPTYFAYLTISLTTCLFFEKIMTAKHVKFLLYVVYAIAATALLIFIGNIAQDAITPILNYLPKPIPTGIHPPYGLNILIPAYITFLEPTIAAFIVFSLINEKLSSFNTLLKGLIMAGIIIVIHAGIFFIVQIINSEGNILYRIFYYGQILWEYLALGLLTAYSFSFMKNTNKEK